MQKELVNHFISLIILICNLVKLVLASSMVLLPFHFLSFVGS